jgi:hypothetical protein
LKLVRLLRLPDVERSESVKVRVFEPEAGVVEAEEDALLPKPAAAASHTQLDKSMEKGWMMRRGVGILISILVTAAPAAAQLATFQNPARFPVSGDSSGATGLMALTDVGSLAGPEDGILDVVTADISFSTVSVLYGRSDAGQPNGRFISGPNSPLGRVPTGLAVDRFNGDNIKDIVITDTGGQLFCYRGFDDGFTPYTLEGTPAAVLRNAVGIETAELNGDGRVDVIVVSEGDQNAGGITILLSNGDCSFSAPVPPADSQVMAGLASSAVAVEDLNQDGILDAAVVNAVSADVTILRRDAQGRYTAVQTIPVQEEPIAIAAGDLNNDSRPDLVITNRNSDSVSVLLARADNSFAAAVNFQSGTEGGSPTGVALGDLSLDGILDVVVPNNRSSDTSILVGDGLGMLFPPRVFVADQEPLALRVGNVNADSAPDVVVVTRGNQGPNASILLGMGDGTVNGVEDLISEPNPTGLGVGDFDNDGRADIIVSHGEGGVILIFESAGIDGFVARPPLQTGDAVEVLPGDYDGNGLLDFVAVEQNESAVAFYAARSNGAFRAPVDVAVGGEPVAGVAADFNRDGFTDMAIVRDAAGDENNDVIEVILANGSGGFGARNSYQLGRTSVEADVGDCNNDGRLDLFVANNLSADVTILTGNGNGTFNVSAPRFVNGSPKSLTVADFDRDGFDDFAVALSMTSGVLVYYGNTAANCSFTVGQQSLSGGGSPSGIAARDFSGDGFPDAFIADEVANSATLFTKTPMAMNRFFSRLAGDDVPVSRRPTMARGGDFDGDGRYDGATANSFGTGSVSVLTNILAPPALRGDGNSDERVTAADVAAVMREVLDGGSTRIEEAARAGYAAGPGVDANGDGHVTPQDALGVAAHAFKL